MEISVLEKQSMLLQNRERVLSEMKKYPNVVSVGVGLKEVNDKLTDVLCYRVYVNEKKPAELLKAHENIPAVFDGFVTDVLSHGIVEEAVDLKPIRPLIGGIQIKNSNYNQEKKEDERIRGGGTLGCLAILNDGSGKIVGLTNQHVTAMNTEDNDPVLINKIAQPFKHICCCCCEKNIIGQVLNSKKDSKVDCAIIEFHDDILNGIQSGGTLAEILGIGKIDGKQIPVNGTKVKKRGAGTGYTEGIVKDVAFDDQQILIEPAEGFEKFADFGDSGSVVLTEQNRVIGLLWGIKRDRLHIPGEPTLLHQTKAHPLFPRLHGIVSPIDLVEEAMNIKIPAKPDAKPTISVLPPDESKTYILPSILAGPGRKKHFVTIMGDGDVILKASFDQPVNNDDIKWISLNPEVKSPAIGTDNSTVKVSRSGILDSDSTRKGRKFPMTLKVNNYPVEEVVVWVVWSKPEIGDVSDIFIEVGPDHFIAKNSTPVWFSIQPLEIIQAPGTVDDVPDLIGPNTIVPPNVPDSDIGVFNKGVDLSQGAKIKWDASIRMRCKVINPDHTLLPVSDPFFQTFLNYPSSTLVGNYETTSLPNEGDPYSNVGINEFGKISSFVEVSFSIRHDVGTRRPSPATNQLEFRIHFQHFARLELGGAWHNISDPFPWRFHVLIKKVSELIDGQDYNNDGFATSELWIDNGTHNGTDNSPF